MVSVVCGQSLAADFECGCSMTDDNLENDDPVAEETLERARYFLSNARKAELDANVLKYRLPFSANIEAAIIYARASIEHLKAQFSPRYNHRGYRSWHDSAWQRYNASGKVFSYFYSRRNFILHQQPESTTGHVNLEGHISIATSISLSMVVTRADGTREVYDESSGKRPPPRAPAKPLTQSQHFMFADSDWREKPATAYVEDFIDCCERFIAEARKSFSEPE
jgi:hypothetical protein